MMKVGFDFDSTLSEPYIQKLASKFIEAGNDVFIITTRSNKKGGWVVNDLEKIAQKLGIERIIYTFGQDKMSLLPEDTDLVFDDDMVEVELINQYTDTVAICSRPMARKYNV